MSLAGQDEGRNRHPWRPGRSRRLPRDLEPKGTGLPKMPPRRTWLWLLLVLGVNFWLARLLMPGPEAPVTIPYTLFKEEVGKEQRPGDLQSRRHSHGTLQDRGHLSAARSGDRGAQGQAHRRERP